MITGRLEFFGINKETGEKEVFEIAHNTILDTLYGKLVQIFGGEANAHISKMQFGTGSLAADHAQTFLQTPITPVKATAAAIDPGDDNTVIFTVYLLDTEANGFPISEAGLMTNDNVLVTRITFAARTKTSSYQFGFKWSITVKA